MLRIEVDKATRRSTAEVRGDLPTIVAELTKSINDIYQSLNSNNGAMGIIFRELMIAVVGDTSSPVWTHKSSNGFSIVAIKPDK